MDALELAQHVLAQLLVEGAEGLVEQQHPWSERQRPGKRHPLLLTARELVRHALFVTVQPHQVEQLRDPRPDLVLGPAQVSQREGDVLQDRQVGKQGVVLKNDTEPPPVRRHPGHGLAVEVDLAPGRVFEAGDQQEHRALARAAGSEQGDELPFLDVEAHVVDRRDAAEPLGHGLEAEDCLARVYHRSASRHVRIVSTVRRKPSRTLVHVSKPISASSTLVS